MWSSLKSPKWWINCHDESVVISGVELIDAGSGKGGAGMDARLHQAPSVGLTLLNSDINFEVV